MSTMAIVKATYTKSSGGAKASIRYIQHRPGKDGAAISRTLFGWDGAMGRYEAYRMIESAQKGSVFFRFVISPDPKAEDTGKDLFLREITEKTMLSLEDRLHQNVQWAAVEHNDHAPHRHVHVVAIVKGRLNVQDFQTLRQTATEAALFQRKCRDLAQEQRQREQEREEARDAAWELQP
jgi:hypothetical protein